VVHGVADKHVSVEYGKRIFRNLASPDKEWYPIQDGDHYNLSRVGGEKYRKKVIEFLKRHLKPSEK
jgi:fermentation-respiration switch protein FrsA (DUF1100 family)